MHESVRKDRPLRVLHCPTTVGGNPPSLAQIERRQGLDSWCVGFGQAFFNYPADELIRTAGFRKIFEPCHRVRLLLRALRSFDVIHFNFGSSILPIEKNLAGREPGVIKDMAARLYNAVVSLIELKDVGWLKRAGKVIAVTMQGDDARQWDWSREHFRYTPAKEIDVTTRAKNDAIVRRRIRVWDRHADLIYAVNPDLLHVLPERAQFCPYAHPDINDWQFTGIDESVTRPVRIVHAPSSRLVKGTKYIMAAIEQLRREGLPFEFTLVEGMSNAEARSVYEQSDVLVDQLLCGWYGGVSAEFMALGKTVVCYLREDDFRFLPPGMAEDMPILNANPDTVTDVLRRVISMPRADLGTIGRQSRSYVERWHNPAMLGERLKADYEMVRRQRAAAA
jgi:hypothetical protein